MKIKLFITLSVMTFGLSSAAWSGEAKRNPASSNELPRGEDIQNGGLIGKVVEFIIGPDKKVALYVKTKSGRVYSGTICIDTDKEVFAQYIDALKTSLIYKTGVRVIADQNNCVTTIGYNTGVGYESAGRTEFRFRLKEKVIF